jgi:hypothetical protein
VSHEPLPFPGIPIVVAGLPAEPDARRELLVAEKSNPDVSRDEVRH